MEDWITGYHKQRPYPAFPAGSPIWDLPQFGYRSGAFIPLEPDGLGQSCKRTNRPIHRKKTAPAWRHPPSKNPQPEDFHRTRVKRCSSTLAALGCKRYLPYPSFCGRCARWTCRVKRACPTGKSRCVKPGVCRHHQHTPGSSGPGWAISSCNSSTPGPGPYDGVRLDI